MRSMKTLVRLRLVRIQKPMNRFPAHHHDTDSMTMIDCRNHIREIEKNNSTAGEDKAIADHHRLLITMILVIVRIVKKL